MKKTLGKWEQHQLLRCHPSISNHLPETVIYSESKLNDFLNRYSSVYVKHDTTGQGRAILKIKQNQSGDYLLRGYTIQGTPIKKSVCNSEVIQTLLHPFWKFGRPSGLYILQEAIQSCTQNGQPFSIRVHVQKLNSQWVIGGMYGTEGIDEANNVAESGIVNLHRGASVMTVAKMLSRTIHSAAEQEVIEQIESVAMAAADVIYTVLPNREYGMDFGIHPDGRPILFEVNTTPGISGFARLENIETWRRIVEIRKQQ